MKKILFLGLSGGQIHHELPAFYLASKGFSVTCIGLDQTLKIEAFYPTSINLTKLNRMKSSNRILDILLTCQQILLLRKHYDILYLYSPHNIISGWVGSLAFKGKIIYHTQDFLDPNKYKFRAWIEKSVMRKASLTITNEENRGIFLQTFYNLKKRPITLKTTLPSDFPFQKFDFQNRKKIINFFNGSTENHKNIKIILHVGGYSSKRCSTYVIQSLNYLPENFKLIFTNSEQGSASFNSITMEAAALGISSRICILGKLSEIELFELCAQVDVGILLYPDDDIGNIYQAPGRLSEYLGSGIKVIAPNYPGLRYLLEKYSFGSICVPNSAKSIANAITQVCRKNNTQVERELIKSNFRKNYSYDEDFDKVLEQLQLLDH